MPRKQLTGILLAAFAMFLYGTVYWGFSPLPYTALGRSSNDEALGRALKEYLPHSGTYYVPSMQNEAATLERLHNAGPVAMIHLTARDGRPTFVASAMVSGLVLYLVVAFLLSLLLNALAPGAVYGEKLKAAILAGLIAAVMIDVGDTIWWFLPIPWKAFQFFYNFSAIAIGGAVLAKFHRS